MGFLVLTGLRLMTSILTKRKRHVCSKVPPFFFFKWSKKFTYSACNHSSILPINILDRYNSLHLLIVALDCIARFYKDKVLFFHSIVVTIKFIEKKNIKRLIKYIVSI